MRHALDRVRTAPDFATRCGTATTGFLVPHGDVDALRRRMLELAGVAGAESARLGAAARRFAEGLTWESAAAATERHLDDIIAGTATALSRRRHHADDDHRPPL